MLVKFKLAHIKRAVAIHQEALPEDFLPSLGTSFLSTLYQGLIGKRGIFGFVALEKGEVIGFVLGTEDMDKFLKVGLLSNFIKLSLLLFLQILKKPTILKNIFETFFYSHKESGPKAELVVIALDEAYRGRGLGKTLVVVLEKEMKKRKIKEYKLTVTKRNSKAIAFYNRLGFEKKSEFRLYDKKWFVLLKNIK